MSDPVSELVDDEADDAAERAHRASLQDAAPVGYLLRLEAVRTARWGSIPPAERVRRLREILLHRFGLVCVDCRRVEP